MTSLSVTYHKLRESDLWQHFLAFVVLSFLGLVGSVLIAIDRAPPVRVIAVDLLRDDVMGGADVTMRFKSRWLRQCQGFSSREIIDSDGIIHAYAIRALRYPLDLDRDEVEDVPLSIPISLPLGPAMSYALFRFPDCGLTSRLWPIEVRIRPSFSP